MPGRPLAGSVVQGFILPVGQETLVLKRYTNEGSLASTHATRDREYMQKGKLKKLPKRKIRINYFKSISILDLAWSYCSSQ